MTEILIIGGGIAGVTCALELLDQGRQVILVDRDIRKELGGLAKWSFGGMFFVDTKEQRRAGFQDSVDLAKEDWWSCAQFQEDNFWGKQWAEHYINTCTVHGYQWLKSRGLRFFPIVNWAERGLERQGNSVPRFHMIWGTGWELTKRLVSRLEHHPQSSNLKILCGHRVQELLVEGDIVNGAVGLVESSQAGFEVRADATVVATGGINGSIERVKAHWHQDWGSPPKTILNGAHPYAVGDLHDAVSNAGGRVAHLDAQWNYAAGIHHYAPRHPGHGLSLVPGKSQLWLDYKGRRFGPPALMSPFDTRHLVEQICRQEQKYSWQILNKKIALKEFAISGSEHNQTMREKKFLQFIWQTLVTGNRKLVRKIAERCIDFITADDVPSLATKMNQLTGEDHIDAQALRQTIEAFDQQVQLGESSTDDQIQRIISVRAYRGDKARTCNLQPILDRRAGPLVAIRSFIMSRKSLGGVQTDLSCRVLRSDGIVDQKVFSNLFAIGEAAGFGGGGMHGRGSLEGTFLGGCIITGRTCAAAIKGKPLE